MTPDQIAKKNTEAAHQMALLAWANYACQWGFEAAELWASGKQSTSPIGDPVVPELKWLHHINNGIRSGNGKSRQIEGAKTKAMGVKTGVADLFLPVPKSTKLREGCEITREIANFHGLYIEMKAPGKLNDQSEEQKEFQNFVQQQNYAYVVVDNWRNAANIIREYLEG